MVARRAARTGLTPAAPERVLIARERRDLIAYAGGLALFALTALPFLLARVDDLSPGLAALPTLGVWDSVGRARALADEGPLPLEPGRGLSSPLWVWTLAAAYRPLSLIGAQIDAVAKALGWASALVGGLALYNFARLATGRRWAGALTLGLLALDPLLAFGRLSGSEAPLALATGALALLALVAGRTTLAAWLLAAAALARPDGALLAVLLLVVLVVERLWRAGALSAAAERDLWPLARLFAPTAGAIALWALHGLIVSGRPLPGLVEFAGAPAGGLASARSLWGGLLGDHPSFASGFVLVLAGSLVGAAWIYWRALGPRGLTLALLPLAMLGGLLLAAPTGEPTPWSYDLTRLAEPALAWCALALAISLATAGELIWRSRRAPIAPLEALPMARLLALVPLLYWALNLRPGWLRAPGDYAWGATVVAELPLRAGEWLAENAEPAARVGVTAAAAGVRATAGRPVLDLPTWNERIEAELRELAIDYAVAEPSDPLAAWPRARALTRFDRPEADGRPARSMAVYRLEWQLPELDPAQPIALRAEGFMILDTLDVAEPLSEARHFYMAASAGAPLRGLARLPVGWIRDDGRAQESGRGGESFTLAARPGRDLVLGARYDGSSRGALRVELERQPFDWRLRDCGATICEDALVLPGGLVRSASPRLTITFTTQPGGQPGRVGIYRYWSIVRA
ncbi:MAG TPA: hypothetical protein VGL23_00545 [Chloroflexota bacterium]|jgi:hypothetical protein